MNRPLTHPLPEDSDAEVERFAAENREYINAALEEAYASLKRDGPAPAETVEDFLAAARKAHGR